MEGAREGEESEEIERMVVPLPQEKEERKGS